MAVRKIESRWKYLGEVSVWLIICFALAAIALAVVRSHLSNAIIPAILLFGALWLRLRDGPAIALPLCEVDSYVLSIAGVDRMHRVERESLKEIRLVGPIRGRTWRLFLKNGAVEEVRLSLWGPREADALALLKDAWGDSIRIVEEEPPPLLSRIRGDF